MNDNIAKLTEERNSNLDIIRIIAAFLVLSVHLAPYAGLHFAVGRYGVQLFFVLSGFLGYASLERTSSIKNYYKKRVIRILPTYYVCLSILYIRDLVLEMASLPSLEQFLEGQCGPKFLRYVFCLHMITPSDNWNMWNNHSALWTMSSFVVFYLIAPVLHKVLNRFYQAFIVLIVFMIGNPYIVFCIEEVFSEYPEQAYINYFAQMNPLTVLYCFILGITVYLALKESKKTLFSLILLIIIIVSEFSWYSYELIFALMILVALAFPPLIKNSKINIVIQFIGQGSFAMYLLHPIVLDLIQSLRQNGIGFNSSGVVYAAWLYLIVLVISYTIHLGILKIENYINNRF